MHRRKGAGYGDVKRYLVTVHYGKGRGWVSDQGGPLPISHTKMSPPWDVTTFNIVAICRYWICVMHPVPWQYRMHLLWSESGPNSVALLFAHQLFSNLTWGAVMQVAGEISGISVSLMTHNMRENIGLIGFSNSHIDAISGYPSRFILIQNNEHSIRLCGI